jgi:ATP-dependent DNA ligase
MPPANVAIAPPVLTKAALRLILPNSSLPVRGREPTTFWGSEFCPSLGLEGIVSKRRGSHYRSGRFLMWAQGEMSRL